MSEPLDFSVLEESIRWVGYSEGVTQALLEAAQRVSQEKDGPLTAALVEQRARLISERKAPERNQEEPLLPALVFLSAAPVIHERHRARKIPDAIVQRTFRGLGVWIQKVWDERGVWGLDEVAWPVTYFSGRLIVLGRLQFEMRAFPAECVPPEGMSGDSPVISVHIPAEGRLDAAACEDAFAQAADFFPRYFPDFPFQAMICVSWMMHRELERALPPESNLVQFLRRFEPLEMATLRDGQVWQRVFGLSGVPEDLACLPRDSTLRRVVLDFAQRGERWWTSGGIIRR